jgi:hypothetical protein
VIERDGTCVITAEVASNCAASHMIPHAKGSDVRPYESFHGNLLTYYDDKDNDNALHISGPSHVDALDLDVNVAETKHQANLRGPPPTHVRAIRDLEELRDVIFCRRLMRPRQEVRKRNSALVCHHSCRQHQ